MQDFEVKERLREHLEYLCSFDKLSGEPEAYRAVDGYDGTPQRISTPEPTRPASGGLSPHAPQGGNTP